MAFIRHDVPTMTNDSDRGVLLDPTAGRHLWSMGMLMTIKASGGETGGTCSAASVRALLKDMISAESQDAPLSDVSLTRMLADQGIVVARRTVSKYRGMMKVPPAELRRQV